MELKFVKADSKNMPNGLRDNRRTPLTEKEIRFIKEEIARIKADESVFVFNDPDHIEKSTCYNIEKDKIYVTRNVLPDLRYFSSHPRDALSVAAVLAHEYYGHRPYRIEYLKDLKKGLDFHTTPIWEDECRASITAAKITPNLRQLERSTLIADAVRRAEEFGQIIEMDDAMKEIAYGKYSDEKNITFPITPIVYVSARSQKGIRTVLDYACQVSEMRESTGTENHLER